MINKNGVVYVYVYPIRVEVTTNKESNFKENPIDKWEGHWTRFIDYNHFTNQRVISTASEGILTLLSSQSTSAVSIHY